MDFLFLLSEQNRSKVKIFTHFGPQNFTLEVFDKLESLEYLNLATITILPNFYSTKIVSIFQFSKPELWFRK